MECGGPVPPGSPGLECFISFSLTHVTSTFLMITGQLFGRVSSSLDLPGMSSWLGSGHGSSVTWGHSVLLTASHQVASALGLSTTGSGHFGHLTETLFAELLHSEATFFFHN